MKFEAFKGANGKFHWRIRDSNGQVVSFRAGKVMTPPATAKEKRRARTAVNQTLSELAATPKREKA